MPRETHLSDAWAEIRALAALRESASDMGFGGSEWCVRHGFVRGRTRLRLTPVGGVAYEVLRVHGLGDEGDFLGYVREWCDEIGIPCSLPLPDRRFESVYWEGKV